MKYQLLKTSPYLGGQIRWDIPLHYHYENSVHNIDTPELHIVPLDDSIPYVDTKKNADETFNYTHLENIKQLATQIGGSMYSSEGEWSGVHWLYNNGDFLDPYSHIFNMGARRIPFKRYGKQFSYLCPLWISEEIDARNLEFEISIRIIGEERDHIVRRVFGLSDRICEYMNEYIWKSSRWVEPDPSDPTRQDEYQGVDDNLLSIKFDPDYAYITGVHTLTGTYVTKDITYLINGILDREIPMMEFDNMLVSKFRENNMIAQQLINLNFTFNLDDISYTMDDLLLGKSISINMRVKYCDDYLDIKDFYTNYSKIPGYRVDLSEMSNSINVCEYLGDNHIVDYIYTNKFTQPIFHWSMIENPRYIYNFYDGFAPTFISGDEYIRIQGHYYDQADIFQVYHNNYNSAATWCKLVNFIGFGDASIIEYNEQVLEKPDKYASKLIINKDTRIAYLNNNRFDLTKSSTLNNENFVDLNNIYVYSTIQSISTPNINEELDVIKDDNGRIYLHFICDDIKYSTFRRFSRILDILGDNTQVTDLTSGRTFQLHNSISANEWKRIQKLFINLYNCWIPPYKIEFTKGIVTSNCPDFDEYRPQETIMHKYDMCNDYVFRYTGVLCPMFVDPDDDIYKNYVYRYKQWGSINDERVQQYNRMLKTGMNPLFPSIDFYSLVEEEDTDNLPAWYTDNWPWEIIWKNNGMLYNLPKTYSTSFVFEFNDDNQITEEDFWSKLYDYITEIGIPVNTVWMKHKMKELYEISYNFDYETDDNLSRVVYFVKFDLV